MIGCWPCIASATAVRTGLHAQEVQRKDCVFPDVFAFYLPVHSGTVLLILFFL